VDEFANSSKEPTWQHMNLLDPSTPSTSHCRTTPKPSKMSTARIPILVTGGCGFLGTEIVSALLSTSRYAITVIDINPPALGTSTFTQYVRYVRCNVLDLPALESVLAEAAPAIVVHTVGVYRLGAARYSMVGKEAEFQVNVEGTRNVVEAAKKCGARGLVYTSSVTVVLDEMGVDFRNVDERWPTGRATTSYGQSKVCLCNSLPSR
jgi:sterol-4alpha-carboxylate 3-dehydrogenase (decarboxylating)